MPDSIVRLKFVDLFEMALSMDLLEGAVIKGRVSDGSEIEVQFSARALAKLESFLVHANVEQAKHHSSH